MNRKAYFITGATGFLGQEILSLLAREPNNRFYCLVRGAGHRSPQQRMADICAEIGFAGDTRFTAVEGDLRVEKFGLDDGLYERLCSEVCQITHCAADVRFNQPFEKIRAVNVLGTANICEFAQCCRQNNRSFEQLNYIGTAFVAGNKKGIVYESELSDRYGFKNTYEQTKYEAEVLVRSYISNGLPVIIFRPSIVLGAAETGKAKPTNVAYPVLKFFSRWNASIISFNGKTTIDLVPVDFVARSIVYLAAAGDNIGRTFHLAAGAEKNTTLKRLFEIACESYEKKIRIIPFTFWRYFLSPVLKHLRPRQFKNDFYSTFIGAYKPYMWESSPIFSTAETQKALAGSGVEIPSAERFMKNFFDYAQKTNYGRKENEENGGLQGV